MQAKLIESTDLAPGVRHFVFEAHGLEGREPGQHVGRLHFLPGQFVSFSDSVNGKIVTRAYSIASPPGHTNRFELCLNRVSDGLLSNRLFEMKPGDAIEMQQPLGMFTMRQPPRESVFIATGTGIAPFRSMLKAHLNESSPQFTLLFGVRYESHLMYRREFEEAAEFYPQFHFWPTLSQPERSWTGRQGHVQAHLEEAIAGRRDLDFYLCGLKLMVDDVRAILKGMGFDRKQIFYEKYD